jgi:hypothetical protein
MVGSEIMDLVQDVTTDCSVVASLCAAISRTERGHHAVRYFLKGYTVSLLIAY